MVTGSSENLRAFNFAILLKSRKFGACKISVLRYVFTGEFVLVAVDDVRNLNCVRTEWQHLLVVCNTDA